jgi:uncharacterized membrane protein YjgN (DUF898 family)
MNPAAVWYYLSGGQQLGPVTAAQLKEMVGAGRLRPADMVWKEGLAQWIPASSVKGLFGGGGAAAVPRAAPGHGPAEQRQIDPRQDFVFTGTAGPYFKTWLLSSLLALIPLAAPWASCMMERWKANNTYVRGKRLRFDGSGLGLLGNWIKWFFFLTITLGIYYFWFVPNYNRWIIENTKFADD